MGKSIALTGETLPIYARALDEWTENEGVLCVDTEIELNNAGLDPDELKEHFESL